MSRRDCIVAASYLLSCLKAVPFGAKVENRDTDSLPSGRSAVHCQGRLRVQRLYEAAFLVPRTRWDRHRHERIPLADRAQRLAGGEPLVNALHVEAMLTGQDTQLLPFPAIAPTLSAL